MRKYIGDRAFYKKVFFLMIPIMIQNGITNFVSLLDNFMVGRVGTEVMTGVASANQIIFVFNLCIFGAVSGAGIFGAQFFGSGDTKGFRDTFRFKLVCCTLLTAAAILIFIFQGKNLIGLYLRGEGEAGSAEMSLDFGYSYLLVMLIGLLPSSVVQCYSSTLRESGQTLVPMLSGAAAVCVNMSLNYVLIFGKLGAPALGCVGAAVATVIARFVELTIVAAWTHRNKEKNPFIIGAYRTLAVPAGLCKEIIKKGMPLALNEALWSVGMAALNFCYSLRSLDVVAANSIASTCWNLFSVSFLAVGAAIGIIIGQQLGAGENVAARDTARKLIAFSLMVSVFVGGLYYIAAPFIPRLYNTTDSVRSLASGLMYVGAFVMPIDACANACYFTLRSGGKTAVTFLFDSCFVWCVSVPAAYLLTSLTSLPVTAVFAAVQTISVLKCVFGLVLVRRGVWVKNIVK